MARRNNRKALVPESREALNQLKKDVLVKDGIISADVPIQNVNIEVGKEIGIALNHQYNGQLSTQEAGKIGGQIGGRMVKELVRMAQEKLAKNDSKH